jgi:hypothetical protein
MADSGAVMIKSIITGRFTEKMSEFVSSVLSHSGKELVRV